MRDLRQTTTAQLLLAPPACAGLPLAVLGAVESVYVADFGSSATWYAFGLYGLVGLLAGLVWSLLFGGKARRMDFGLVWLCSRAAAVPSFVLSLGAAGFLVWRDLWKESAAEVGLVGWAAMLAVVLGAALIAVIARWAARALMLRAKLVTGLLFVACLGGLWLGRVIDGDGLDVLRPDESTQPDPRSPIVLIVVDALRTDAVGAYSGEGGNTPHLDAFARDAVVFTETWTTSTWTRPAVASILTGLYPASHRTMHKTDRLPSTLPTLAGLLKQHGYAGLASVTNVNLAPAFGLGRGFDAWGYLAPRPHLAAPNSARRLFLVELFRLLRLRFFPGHREVSAYYAPGEQVSQQARELIAPWAEKRLPFFAYLHYMEPHDPYFAHPYDGRAVARVEDPSPPKEKAPEMHDLYRQEVGHLDALLGELFAFLKERGLYDSALIIVTSDHGEEFADHGHFWHGTSLYRELLRVPLMVRFPGGTGSGSRLADPVSVVDLMPTALSAAGLAPNSDLPGRDLRPLVAKPLSPAVAEPSADQPTEQPAALAVAPTRSLFAELDHQGCVLEAVRVGDWKLILANPDNPRGIAAVELFDLASDREERRNLARSQAARVKQLRAVLEAGRRRAAAEKPVQPEQVEVDAATEEQLRSLGYTQ